MLNSIKTLQIYFLKPSLLVLFSLILLTSAKAKTGDDLPERKNQSSLFLQEDLLEFSLLTDIKALLADCGENREYHPAKIIYRNAKNRKINIDLKVKTRGNFRRKSQAFNFPPLKFNFKKENTLNTIFQGEDKLKLVTTGNINDPDFETYVLKEYLAYKTYNLITPNSFRVRLVKITYIDANNLIDTIQNFAFFIEDKNALATRNNGKIQDLEEIKAQEINETELNVLALYEYLIGNNDWFLFNMHNLKLIQRNEKKIVVPYDFDWSGIVNAKYAISIKPDAEITERVYRGFTSEVEKLNPAILIFNKKQTAILNLYENFTYLDGKERRSTLRYINKFYKTINNPNALKNEITKSKTPAM